MLFRPYSTAELAVGGTKDMVNLLDDDRPIKEISNKISNSNNVVQSKKVSYHWDKIVTIPDRPDEIIFLLGVTKSLYYTALPGSTGPYPEEPFLAKTTRYDFSDYIYGTPVMELWTHNSRITSLSVSPFGQIAASGDENGNLKLLVLRLLDELSISLKADQKKKRKNSPAAINTFRPEHKITQLAHSGPVFSMQWLTTVCEGTDYIGMRAYCLATGSTDRSVKLWRVTCSTRHGLTMQPLMFLDTLTTHILCLGSFLETCIVPDTHTKILSLNKKDEETNSLLKTVETRRQQLAHASTAQSVTAAMGLGTDIRGTITLDNPFDTQEPVTPFRVISGKPKPLASTGLSLLSEHVFLAAGTNLGAVYVWKIRWKFLVDILSQCYDRSIKLSTVLDDGSHLHSLVQSSDRPVINVALSAAIDTNIFDNAPVKASSLRDMLKQRSERNTRVILAASDTNGTVRTHCEVDACDPSGRRVTTLGVKGPITICGEARYPSAVVSCAFIENDLVSEAALADMDIENGQQIDPVLMLKSTSKLFVCLSDGTMQLARSDTLTKLSTLRTDKAYIEQKGVHGFYSDSASRAAMSLMHTPASIQSNSIVTEVNFFPQLQEENFAEDSILAAVGTKNDLYGNNNKRVLLFPFPEENHDHRYQVESNITGHKPPHLRAEEEESISGPVPRALPEQIEPSEKPLVSMQQINTAQPGKATQEDRIKALKRLGKKVVIDEKGNTVSTDKEKTSDKNDRTHVLSDYSYPSISSSHCVYASLMHTHSQLENVDDISISTIHTTSTDRYVAANVASTTRFGPAGSQYNYRGIVPIDLDPRPAQKKKIQKQIDPNWVARKQFLSPTSDDLRLLCPPDPYVKINIKTTMSTSANSFPLKAFVDPDELVPRFAVDVSLDDVFGKNDKDFAKMQVASCLDKIGLMKRLTTVI